MNKLTKALGIFLYFVFCFFVFISFNPKSMTMILNGMDVGSEFYQKTQNAMIWLMFFLMVSPLQIFIIYVLLRKNRIDQLKKVVFLFLILSIGYSLTAYYFSGVFPFSIPLIN